MAHLSSALLTTGASLDLCTETLSICTPQTSTHDPSSHACCKREEPNVPSLELDPVQEHTCCFEISGHEAEFFHLGSTWIQVPKAAVKPLPALAPDLLDSSPRPYATHMNVAKPGTWTPLPPGERASSPYTQVRLL